MNNIILAEEASNGGMMTGIIVAVVVAVILIAIISIVAWYINTMNWFRRTEVKVNEARSGIDVALTKRFDLLTKMLASVKGYAKHESETLTNVIKMRSGKVEDLTLEEKSQLNTQMNEVQRNLNMVIERYPELKADTQFTSLNNACYDCEEQLQASRRVFNSNVSAFNQKRVTFPSSWVAKRIGYLEDLEFFKAEENKRQDVKFDF